MTVYEPAPVPTVTCASAAAVRVRKPPTLSLNAAASTFSPLSAPAVFDVSCNRYELSPTCTAVAVTPAPAALMFPTTVARLPSPVLTLLPLTVPVDSPLSSVAVIVPAAALSVMLPPAVEVGEGLVRAAVDLQDAVGARVGGAVGRQRKRTECVAARDLQRCLRSLTGGTERERSRAAEVDA